MTNKSYEIKRPNRSEKPVIFSSPHSGSNYPSDFLAQSGLDLIDLRSSEDAFVDTIFNEAPQFGAFLLKAVYPRSYVDLNRRPDELDFRVIKGVSRVGLTKRTLAGLGVIPRFVGRGKPIQNKMITLEQAKIRLESFYFPYHRFLSDLLSSVRSEHGFAILFDCHSMPNQFNQTIHTRKKTPDIILGDCYGSSCNGELMNKVEHFFREGGFTVERNNPFSGGYITESYGCPSENIHAVQLEINRSLYMDEISIKPNSSFNLLREKISKVIKRLIETDYFKSIKN